MTRAELEIIRRAIELQHKDLCAVLVRPLAEMMPHAREALDILDRQIPDENKAPAAYPPAYPASMYE